MESKARHQLTRLLSPGFFARLSNIIVVQVLFVFGAVVLLVFFPEQQSPIASDFILPKSRLQIIADKTGSALARQICPTEDLLQNEKVQSSLFPLFLEEQAVIEAGIFVPVGDEALAPIFTFQRPGRSRGERSSDHKLSDIIDPGIIRLGLKQPGELYISSFTCPTRLIHYYRFQVSADLPAVLVAVTEPNPAISDRSQLKYALFVLFLCSVLVSLLTVYLISNRFKGPLDRLIQGFEKTAEGELFYLFETDGDVELRKLAAAFNRMSEALWRNHKKLKQSNYRLANANRAFMESQLFLATLIDSSPSCILTADSQGRIMIFNRKASEVFGYDKEEAIGKNADQLFTNAARESRVSQPSGDSLSAVEVLCQRRDGSTFPAYLIVSPVVTQAGSAAAHLYIIRDISESKSFQQMMIRLDRYYTRGEMASQIAHEINNYLAVLSGNIELLPLVSRRGDQDKFHDRLEVMKQTVDKIARFSNGLMEADQDKTVFEPADINQLVENTVAFLKPQNRFDRIVITTILSPDISLVELDVGQIQQLLVNLLHNAAEALEDQPDQKKICVTTSVGGEGSERWAHVEIKDNGPGVAGEKEKLLFTKRFTTKRKGHGLGLITGRKIVEAHNGRIAYRQEEGATFSFHIPIKRREVTGAPTPEAAAQQSSQPA